MNDGIGRKLWTISVALYLIANGVLGLTKWAGGDFDIIFRRMKFSGGTLSFFVTVASVIALIAGIFILIEMFGKNIRLLDTLILIVAIIWAVYVVIEIISWVTGGFDNLWHVLQMLAVHLMVLASLLIASKRFG